MTNATCRVVLPLPGLLQANDHANPNIPRCSSQSSGTSPCRPRIAWRFKCRGCRPSRIARMMSGASRDIRSTSHTHPTSSFRLRPMNWAMPPSECIVASALHSTLPASIAVPAFAPDLEKIMIKCRRPAPSSDTDRLAACPQAENLALSRSNETSHESAPPITRCRALRVT